MNVRTDTALQSLDAAVTTLTASEQERAEAALERILAAAPPAGAPPCATPTPARPSRRRLVLVPMAALALIVSSLVLQGGSDGDAAYASWTAAPSSVASDDLDVAVAACQGKLQRDDTIDGDRARLVLAERRGDHVALLYRTENPDLSAPCLVRSPPGSTDVDSVDFGVGGSTGPALGAPTTGFTQGAVFQYDDGASSITDGAVGEAVTGVTIHAGALTVQATVENGRYAAWWPGSAFESEALESGGRGTPRLKLTYDLTLSDGTVIHDAQPTRPS
jgi:hypothetical protein